MLTLAGRLRIATLGLSFILGAAHQVSADHECDCPDHVAELVIADGQTVDATTSRAEIKSPKLLQVAESEATPVSGEVAVEAQPKHQTSNSHRRWAAEEQISNKSSRRSYSGRSAITEPTIERMRQRRNADVTANTVEVPAAGRSTLSEVMRRLAGWNESCPMCGKTHAGQNEDVAEVVALPNLSAADRQMLGYIGREKPIADDEELSRPLRAGEPAQVILDTQRRLGKSVLDGTEFGGSPELLIQWIRALDDENRRQQAMLEEVSLADAEDTEVENPAVSRSSQIEALRTTCRQLQEAADVLEEQNLFESADSVRGIADVLRRQSRAKVSELETNKQAAASPSEAAEQ